MEKQILVKQKANSVEKTALKGGGKVLQGNQPVGEQAQERKKMRIPRSRKYIKALEAADRLSENDKEIIEAVQNLPVNNKLIGILANCTIQGCIIHAINKWGVILQHFKSIDEMDLDLRQGYEIFLQYPNCSSVEVYTQTFCVVYEDGTVKMIERN